jgi:hypothetical protein
MTFEQFQNQARLYVIGALYPDELAKFELAAATIGPRAQKVIREFSALRDAFALSLRPPAAQESVRSRLASLIRRP